MVDKLFVYDDIPENCASISEGVKMKYLPLITIYFSIKYAL
jgi:hypothetical protein